MKVRSIVGVEDIDALEVAIVTAADTTAAAIRRLAADAPGIQTLARLKFEQIGRDPLCDRPLNFVEQLNQTFTYLATCDALRYLFAHDGEHAPFVVNLGTQPGHDIASQDGRLVAEVFAATHTQSNGKLQKDVKKLRANTVADVRYLFYSCPAAGVANGVVDPLVRVVSLGLWAERERHP